MDYTGNICYGCDTVFKEDDDIVVCPECGTPQHRECYDKENRCVCSDRHSEGYVWQGTVKRAPAVTEKPETVSCPNCGIDNPKGSEVCRNCGMKFTLFGMNVVDAIHDREKDSSDPDINIPDYKAPFTLGEGEGFDPDEAQKKAAAADFMKTVFAHMSEGNSQQGEENTDKRLVFEGPFPLQDEIGGVRTNTIGTFIGANALAYISKFRKIQSGKLFSFNFAAFFLTPYWFFFRKLYKAGILFMTALLALGIVFADPMNRCMELIQQLYTTAELTQAQFDTLMLGLSELMPTVYLYSALTLLLNLICGFSANHIYKKHVTDHAKNAENLPEKKIAMAYIIKNGGASILVAIGAYFAQQLLSIFVSYLL